MISCNGLCLKNIWMERQSTSQMFHPQDTPNGQMFQVQTVAFIGSTCTVSVLAALPSKDDAKVPVDGGHPVPFLQLKLLVTLAKEDTKKKVLLQKSRLRNILSVQEWAGDLPCLTPLSLFPQSS